MSSPASQLTWTGRKLRQVAERGKVANVNKQHTLAPLNLDLKLSFCRRHLSEFCRIGAPIQTGQ